MICTLSLVSNYLSSNSPTVGPTSSKLIRIKIKIKSDMQITPFSAVEQFNTVTTPRNKPGEWGGNKIYNYLNSAVIYKFQ
jgi:hypothetical protein